MSSDHVRTAKIIGKVFGHNNQPASMVVNYNSEQVFSGLVPTSFTEIDPQAECNEVLCTWETSSSATGNFPISITVADGALLLQSIVMNYVRHEESVEMNPTAVWPAHKPVTIREFGLDANSLTNEEFYTKYQLDKNARNTHFNITRLTDMADRFMTPAKGHGKTNVRINGVLQPQETYCCFVDWNGTLEFNQFVVPEPPSMACIDGCNGLDGRHYLI
jgi:hypothetical protein